MPSESTNNEGMKTCMIIASAHTHLFCPGAGGGYNQARDALWTNQSLKDYACFYSERMDLISITMIGNTVFITYCWEIKGPCDAAQDKHQLQHNNASYA